MKWLKSNYTTLAMAVILSLLTVGMLMEPGEEVPPVTVTAKFDPRLLADVGSLQYRVDGKLLEGTIPILVSGDPAQVQAVHNTLTCRPTLDESKFDPDLAKYETSIVVTAEDFALPPTLEKRINIRPVTVAITYARLVPVTLPVKATAADVQDASNPRFRVVSVTVEPPEIKAKIPANQVNLIKELPIKPIRIGLRTSTFRIQGEINPEVVEAKSEPFFVTVELSPIESNRTMDKVPLFLSYTPLPGLHAELIDRFEYKVVLDGPQNLLERLKPDQVHVYVKLDWTADTEARDYQVAVRCDLADEALRKAIRVRLEPGQPIMATVRVTRS